MWELNGKGPILKERPIKRSVINVGLVVAEFPVVAGNSKTHFSYKKLFLGKAKKSFCLGKQMLAFSIIALCSLKKKEKKINIHKHIHTHTACSFLKKRNHINHKQTNRLETSLSLGDGHISSSLGDPAHGWIYSYHTSYFRASWLHYLRYNISQFTIHFFQYIYVNSLQKVFLARELQAQSIPFRKNQPIFPNISPWNVGEDELSIVPPSMARIHQPFLLTAAQAYCD